MKFLSAMTLTSALLLAQGAFAQGTAAQRDACEADANKWCPYDIPDVNAIEACLRKNIKWISPACQAQFGYKASRQ
jgi:hypothetical protein